MRNFFISIVKNNNFVYKIYTLIFNFIFNFLKLFIKTDDKIILFNSFGGKKFDDSPKVIYEYVINNSYYKDFKIYWGFENPELFDVKCEKLKIDTLKYFIIALKAKYWITNSSIERGLKFKNKNTIYINSWHGTPMKKMGSDIDKNEKRYLNSQYNYFLSQSQYDIDVFSRAFSIEKSKFLLTGLPRNFELYNINNEFVNSLKYKLNIDLNKKIVLYAPTYRDYINNRIITFDTWKKVLGDQYIVLFRAHYEDIKKSKFVEDDFIKNVSNYPNLNDLLIVSDILVSDYSSIMFDYSILERPIYSFAYDYDEYIEKRGLYIDLKNELPNGIQRTEEEFLKLIKNCNYEIEKQKTKSFSEKYIQNKVHDCKFISDIIK